MAEQLSLLPIDPDRCCTSQLLSVSPLHGTMCISPSFSEDEAVLYHLHEESGTPLKISLPNDV